MVDVFINLMCQPIKRVQWIFRNHSERKNWTTICGIINNVIKIWSHDINSYVYKFYICGWSSETRVSEKLWWDWTSCSKFHFARIKRISQMANLILNTFQVVFTIKLHPLAIYFIFAFSHQRGFFWLVRFFEIEVSEDWFKKEKGGCVIVGEGILAWDHCKESPLSAPPPPLNLVERSQSQMRDMRIARGYEGWDPNLGATDFVLFV